MANLKIEEIEGIGAVSGEKLRAIGIKDSDGFIDIARTRKGREEIATKTGMSGKNVLKWANMIDLCRIKGVAAEYAELLEVAGVDTVKELATRKPENLAAKMAEVNETRKLTRKVPSAIDVQKWVAEAKTLPGLIEH